MTVAVRRAGPADAAAWDAYVARAASFFHRWGWGRAIETVHRHEAVYLIAEEGAEVAGVLPLIDRRSAFLGRALISTAFTVGGGVAADTEEARDALLAAAADEAAARRSAYVELRGGEAPEGWQVKEGVHAGFSRAIDLDEEARLRAIPRKKRADVRKAIRAAGEGAIAARVTGDLPGFWSRYAVAQRDHGTPVPPRRLLEACAEAFGEEAEVAEVFVDGAPAAGVLSFYHRGAVHLYHAYVGPAARRHHAGDYLYWWVMGHAATRGARVFDLGRSKRGAGSFAYKTHWGLTPEPLRYAYLMADGAEMPDVSPNNPKFAAMTRAWRRLPLPVANRLGPVLYGQLG